MALIAATLFFMASCTFHRKVAGKNAKTIVKDSSLTKLVDTMSKPLVVKEETKGVPALLSKHETDSVALEHQMIDMLAPVWASRRQYNTFSGKAKVHYGAEGNDQEFTANFRIRKDSMIWVAISAMGGMVQAARVCVTPDSLKLINYLQKEVICLSIKDAAKLLPTDVDFKSLQSLILGEPLAAGAIMDASGFGTTWSIDAKDKNYLQHVTYAKSDTSMVSAEIKTVAPNGPQAMMEYGDYQNAGSLKFAQKRVMNIQNRNEIYSIDMDFSNVQFDQALEYPFNLPKNYTRK